MQNYEHERCSIDDSLGAAFWRIVMFCVIVAAIGALYFKMVEIRNENQISQQNPKLLSPEKRLDAKLTMGAECTENETCSLNSKSEKKEDGS